MLVMGIGEGKRVVSLVAAGCDIIRALGGTHLLVGHAHAICDAAEIEGLEVCTESATGEMQSGSESAAAKLAMEALVWEAELGCVGTSSSLVEWALAPHRVLLQTLKELKPDIIITQLLASETVGVASVQAALEEFLGWKVQVVRIDTKWLGGIFEAVATMAQELGLRSESILKATQDRIHTVKSMCRGRPKRRVLCLQWDTSEFLFVISMSVGMWAWDVIHLVGGVDPFSKARGLNSSVGIDPPNGEGKSYPYFVTMDSISTLSLDILILSNPQWSLDQMYHELVTCKKYVELLLHLSSLAPLHLVAVNGPSFLSRPSPSVLVDSMEALCEILHPECQPFGHQGLLWTTVALIE